MGKEYIQVGRVRQVTSMEAPTLASVLISVKFKEKKSAPGINVILVMLFKYCRNMYRFMKIHVVLF